MQRIAPGPRPLLVSAAAYDSTYQRLVKDRGEATQPYSLHTTGFSFDVARRYGSRARANALQFMLDRLQALDLVAWARTRTAIHVTAAGDADQLLALLGRPGGIGGR